MMLYERICRLEGDADQPAVITPDGTTSWSQLRASAIERAQEFSDLRARRVGLLLPATSQGITMLAALDACGAATFLLDENLSSDAARQSAVDLGLDVVLTYACDADRLNPQRRWQRIELSQRDSNESASSDVSGAEEPWSTVTILTSGTEGKPKAAQHTWQTLARPVRTDARFANHTWLLSFRVHLYAGLQVVLQSLLNHGTLVIAPPDLTPDQIVKLMIDGGVDHASATPSYWRRLALFADRKMLSQVPLRQVTMGGEPADQQVLDSLHEMFPQARIVHIYATTELGRCFSVTDGLAGFPVSFLKQPTVDGVELKIDRDQLFVRPVHAMQGYDRSGPNAAATENDANTVLQQGDSSCRGNSDGGDGGDASVDGEPVWPDTWFATGDLVTVDQDRVHFAGRMGDMINVGGNKVRPLLVEQVVRSVHGVVDARIYGQSSSIAGQLVACEYVAASGTAPDELKRSIAAVCAEKLQPYECPRFFRVVESIEMSAAGKRTRGSRP